MINNIRIYSDPNDIERKYYKRTITIDTFTQPTLIRNGILGGDFFAVYASEEKYNYDAYHAFDSKGWYARTYTADFILYNPNQFCITELTFSKVDSTFSNNGFIHYYTLYGSNDNNNWIEIDTYDHTSDYGTVTDIINNTNFYKYYKMVCNNSSHRHYIGMSNLIITATEKIETITESTSSDYDFYKDYRKYSLMPEQENIYYKYTNWTQPLLTSNNSSSEIWIEDPHLTGAQANYNDGSTQIETWGTSSLSSFSNVYKALDSDTNNFFNLTGISISSSNDNQQIYNVIDVCFKNYMKITHVNFSCIFVWGSGGHCSLVRVIIYSVDENNNLSPVLFNKRIPPGSLPSSGTAVITIDGDITSNNTKIKRLRVCLKPSWDNNQNPCQMSEISFTGQEAIESTSSDYDFYNTVNKYYTLRI